MSVKPIDIAYNTLLENKSGLSFVKLWEIIREQLGYDDSIAAKKISKFYTNLSLDGRFVGLADNVWNLKVNCKYNDIAVDVADYEDTEDEDEEENEENEYEEIDDSEGSSEEEI